MSEMCLCCFLAQSSVERPSAQNNDRGMFSTDSLWALRYQVSEIDGESRTFYVVPRRIIDAAMIGMRIVDTTRGRDFATLPVGMKVMDDIIFPVGGCAVLDETSDK